MLRDIRSHQRGVRLIEVHIDVSELDGAAFSSDGVLRGFEHVEAMDIGFNTAEIRLKNPGTRPCMFFGQSVGATSDSIVIGGILPTNSLVTATHAGEDFFGLIMVFDSPDET